MYARGLSVRDIQAMLEEQYRIEVSPAFISTVTDAVHAEVSEWQNRPLEKMDPLIFFDALRVRIRDEGTVRNKAVSLALGVAAAGTREVLGLWIEQNEGAKLARPPRGLGLRPFASQKPVSRATRRLGSGLKS